MRLAQVFKTLEGARKRGAFENAHCEQRYRYVPIRYLDGQEDVNSYDVAKFKQYTWRLERGPR